MGRSYKESLVWWMVLGAPRRWERCLVWGSRKLLDGGGKSSLLEPPIWLGVGWGRSFDWMGQLLRILWKKCFLLSIGCYCQMHTGKFLCNWGGSGLVEPLLVKSFSWVDARVSWPVFAVNLFLEFKGWGEG